jgi:hypothetical protein
MKYFWVLLFYLLSFLSQAQNPVSCEKEAAAMYGKIKRFAQQTLFAK